MKLLASRRAPLRALLPGPPRLPGHTLPIGFDKAISQPFMVALMTDLLGPEPHESVLEVRTGLGYQAAVLAELSGRGVESRNCGGASRAKPKRTCTSWV